MKKATTKKAMPAKKMMAAKSMASSMPMMKKGGKSNYRKGGKSMKGC